MKKGDKVYCIKDYVVTDYFGANNFKASVVTSLGRPDVSRMSETELKAYAKYLEDNKDTHIEFIKGKSYIIKSRFLDEITLSGETRDHMFNMEDMLEYQNLFEYFVLEREYRKNKLEELSDVNFSEFLGGLKKKI